MGGYVALEIMRLAPQRVIGLGLMDTSARPDTPEHLQRRRDLVRLAGMGKFMGVTPRLMPSLVAKASLTRPEVTEPIMRMAIEMGREVYIRQQIAIMGRIDSRPSLPSISCPTLVVVGCERFFDPGRNCLGDGEADPGRGIAPDSRCRAPSPLGTSR